MCNGQDPTTCVSVIVVLRHNILQYNDGLWLLQLVYTMMYAAFTQLKYS